MAASCMHLQNVILVDYLMESRERLRWLLPQDEENEKAPDTVRLPERPSRVLLGVLLCGLLAGVFYRYVELRQVRHVLAWGRTRVAFTGLEKALSYRTSRLWFAFATSAVTKTVFLLALFLYAFPLLFHAARVCAWRWFGSTNEYIVALFYVGALGSCKVVWRLTQEFVGRFFLETRHGFNRWSVGQFVRKRGLSVLFDICLAPLALWGHMATIKSMGRFYILSEMIMCVFFNVMSWGIAPFLKGEPLQNDELRSRVGALAMSVGFPPHRIFQVDSAKAKGSSHVNAQFSGFGRSQSISVYETFLKAPQEEILAAVGHELGHWYHSHCLKTAVLGQMARFVIYAPFGYVVSQDWLYESFGFLDVGHPVAIGYRMYVNLVAPIEDSVRVAMNAIMRRQELQADAYAVKLGLGRDLQRSLRFMTRANKDVPSDDPWWVFLRCSHPSTEQRIRALDLEIARPDAAAGEAAEAAEKESLGPVSQNDRGWPVEAAKKGFLEPAVADGLVAGPAG